MRVPHGWAASNTDINLTSFIPSHGDGYSETRVGLPRAGLPPEIQGPSEHLPIREGDVISVGELKPEDFKVGQHLIFLKTQPGVTECPRGVDDVGVTYHLSGFVSEIRENRIFLVEAKVQKEFEDNKALPDLLFYVGVMGTDSYIKFLGGPGIEGRHLLEDHLLVVGEAVAKIKDKLKMQKTKAIQLELVRSRGTTTLKFDVAQEITDYFKDVSKGEIRESASWPDCSFYLCKSLREDKYYQEKLRNFGLFDNFGGGLLDPDNNINIAWVRTVSGSGSIKITENIPIGLLAASAKRIISFLREYFSDVFGETKIIGSVNIEI